MIIMVNADYYDTDPGNVDNYDDTRKYNIIYSKCDYQIFNYDGNGDYEGDDDDVDDNDVSPVLLFPQVDS